MNGQQRQSELWRVTADGQVERVRISYPTGDSTPFDFTSFGGHSINARNLDASSGSELGAVTGTGGRAWCRDINPARATPTRGTHRVGGAALFPRRMTASTQ